MSKSRRLAPSFILILFLYAAAFAIGYLAYWLCTAYGSMHPLIATFIADVVATLIVWLAGILFKNSSLYDPYWSVLPPFAFLLWIFLFDPGFSLVSILLLAGIGFWAIRLTTNWAIRWRGMQYQDWRYTMMHESKPKLWFLSNLFGINLIPTCFVFGGMIPAYYAISQHASAPGALTYIGLAICIGAAVLQLISDIQMELFKKRAEKGQNIDEGLWRYSRHPNYFGEVSLWWGVWLMQMGVVPELWYTVAGPVAMTLLFTCISIPMMEKRLLASRPAYAGYKKKVSMLVPWFRTK